MAAKQDPLLKHLKAVFGRDSFKPHQREIITALEKGRDVLAILPTGGGKSLCYQFPATHLPGLTLVVSPLIALMTDQVAHLKDLGIKAAFLNSSIKKSEQHTVLKDALKGAYQLLYVSPERLISPLFVRFAQKADIRRLIIDEAHCVSLWAYDFRASYLYIPRFVSHLSSRPAIAAFTATASAYMEEDICRLLKLKNPIRVTGGFRRDNLELSVRPVADDEQRLEALKALLRQHSGETGIVYCTSTYTVDDVYKKLSRSLPQVAWYRGDLSNRQKEQAYRQFMSGEGCVMVANSAFGMGIDKENVRFIIHYEMPPTLEDYYQQVGRAGRDGLPAQCILLAQGDDKKLCSRLLLSNGELADARRRFGPEAADLIRKLQDGRLKRMFALAMNGHQYSSAQIQDELCRYFRETRPQELTPEAEHFMSQAAMDYAKSITVLYTAESKVAHLIRNGSYTPGVTQTVNVARRGEEARWVSFSLDGRLNYFDLMVADAVYTLHVHGKDVFYPKNIIELLSGDPTATLRPEKQGSGSSDRRSAILDSLERLSKTNLFLDRRQGNIGFSLDDADRWRVFFKGPFLPLERAGETGFRLLDTPPLYHYGELTNGQFFILHTPMLAVRTKKKKQPDSLENLKLRHYLARRVILAKASVKPLTAPADAADSSKSPADTDQDLNPRHLPTSWSIRLDSPSPKRKGLYDLLEIDLPQTPSLRLRKRKLICEKLNVILDYWADCRRNMESWAQGLPMRHVYLPEDVEPAQASALRFRLWHPQTVEDFFGDLYGDIFI